MNGCFHTYANIKSYSKQLLKEKLFVPNHHSPQVPGYPEVAANFTNPCPQEEEGGRFQKFNSFGQHFAFTSVSNPYDSRSRIRHTHFISLAPQIHRKCRIWKIQHFGLLQIPPPNNIIDNSKLVQKHYKSNYISKYRL